MSTDLNYWLDRFNGNGALAALVVAGMTRRRCPWCERQLRPCNLDRHDAAAHFRQLTIDDVLAQTNPGGLKFDAVAADTPT